MKKQFSRQEARITRPVMLLLVLIFALQNLVMSPVYAGTVIVQTKPVSYFTRGEHYGTDPMALGAMVLSLIVPTQFKPLGPTSCLPSRYANSGNANPTGWDCTADSNGNGTYGILVGGFCPTFGPDDGTVWDATGMHCGHSYTYPTGDADQALAHKNCGCPNPHDPPQLVLGDPVNAGTGYRVEHQTDYVPSPASPAFAFSRKYSSGLMGARRSMGGNWRHSFDYELAFPTSTTVNAIRPDGSTLIFTFQNGLWVSDADVNDKLQQNADGSWLLKSADGNTELYGKLTNLTGPNAYTSGIQQLTLRSGVVYQFGYSDGSASFMAISHAVSSDTGITPSMILPAGQLMQVTDSSGHTLTFAYDDQKDLLQLTAPGNQIYQYRYDDRGYLVSVTWPDQSTRTYLYDEGMPVQPSTSGKSYSALLTGIIDENGTRYATFTYDNIGRSTSTIQAGGVGSYTFSYNSTGAYGSKLRTVTDPLGTVSALHIHNVLGIIKYGGTDQPATATTPAASSSATYDANGNLASYVDFKGTKTTYIYDLTRNLETSRTEAAGTPQARTISTTWHPTFRLPAQVTEPNRVINYTYDANGNLLSKAVTANGTTRTWSYTYNSVGQVLTATDPDSNTSRYVYDTSGNLTTFTDAKGHVTQFTGYDPNGNLLAMTDPNGRVTTFTWDARNRLKSRQTGSDLTSYVYDPVGQLIQVTLPDSSTVTYSYDPAHRLTSVSDSHGNSIAYTLDAAGNHTREDVSDPAGQLAAAQSQVTASQSLPNVVTQ